MAPLAGAVPNNVAIYKHSTPDGVDAADFFTPSDEVGMPNPRRRLHTPRTAKLQIRF